MSAPMCKMKTMISRTYTAISRCSMGKIVTVDNNLMIGVLYLKKSSSSNALSCRQNVQRASYGSLARPTSSKTTFKADSGIMDFKCVICQYRNHCMPLLTSSTSDSRGFRCTGTMVTKCTLSSFSSAKNFTNLSKHIYEWLDNDTAQKTMNLLKIRFYSQEHQRKCWKCGEHTDPQTELFFCNCGVIMRPAGDLDYFKLMGFEQTFDIDVVLLARLYHELQKRLHPDMFNQKSEIERRFSKEQSGLVNRAHETLLKPLKRAHYLLELHGYKIVETDCITDLTFLSEIMEINEELASESCSIERVREIQVINQEKIDRLVSELSIAFKIKNFSLCSNLVIHFQYFNNINDKIQAIERDRL